MKRIKSTWYVPVLLGTLLATQAQAGGTEAEKQSAPAPSPHTVSTNIGLFSQYVFRGITYTDEQFALQGGVDYSHSSGFYAGVWATSLDQDALYGNGAEVDIYAGWNKQLTDDVGINLGVLQYYYPSNESIGDYLDDNQTFGDVSPNTTELNAAITWKWLTLKYSYAVSNFFGIDGRSFQDGQGDSDGSDYIELNFNYTLPYDLNLTLHAGHQRVEGRDELDYTDFLVGLSKNFTLAGSAGWNAGINYTTTDADDDVWVDGKGNSTGDDHVIVYLRRVF